MPSPPVRTGWCPTPTAPRPPRCARSRGSDERRHVDAERYGGPAHGAALAGCVLHPDPGGARGARAGAHGHGPPDVRRVGHARLQRVEPVRRLHDARSHRGGPAVQLPGDCHRDRPHAPGGLERAVAGAGADLCGQSAGPHHHGGNARRRRAGGCARPVWRADDQPDRLLDDDGARHADLRGWNRGGVEGDARNPLARRHVRGDPCCRWC